MKSVVYNEFEIGESSHCYRIEKYKKDLPPVQELIEAYKDAKIKELENLVNDNIKNIKTKHRICYDYFSDMRRNFYRKISISKPFRKNRLYYQKIDKSILDKLNINDLNKHEYYIRFEFNGENNAYFNTKRTTKHEFGNKYSCFSGILLSALFDKDVYEEVHFVKGRDLLINPKGEFEEILKKKYTGKNKIAMFKCKIQGTEGKDLKNDFHYYDVAHDPDKPVTDTNGGD